MAKRDYYEVLSVARGAAAEDIRKEFHKLALAYHPDRNRDKSETERKEMEEKFKEINEAYAVLSNPEKRRQ